MQPAGILGDRASPRDRERQEQRIEARIIESFPDVLAGCQDHPALFARNRCETFGGRLSLLLPHSRPQDHEVAHAVAEPAFEAFEVIVPLSQHER